MVFGQGDTQLGEHAHVSALETQALLEQADELIEVSVALIVLYKFLELLGINNQVETADLSKPKFLLVDAGFVDLLPHLDVVCLAGTLDGGLGVAEMHKGGGQFCPG